MLELAVFKMALSVEEPPTKTRIGEFGLLHMKHFAGVRIFALTLIEERADFRNWHLLLMFLIVIVLIHLVFTMFLIQQELVLFIVGG